jgi:hypothetical protein
MTCNECETVAHCMKHGCIPKVQSNRTIDMAREAGAHPSHNPELWDIWEVSNEALDRLVEYVRADEREAIKAICKAEQTEDSSDLWNVCCTHIINKINERKA